MANELAVVAVENVPMVRADGTVITVRIPTAAPRPAAPPKVPLTFPLRLPNGGLATVKGRFEVSDALTSGAKSGDIGAVWLALLATLATAENITLSDVDASASAALSAASGGVIGAGRKKRPYTGKEISAWLRSLLLENGAPEIRAALSAAAPDVIPVEAPEEKEPRKKRQRKARASAEPTTEPTTEPSAAAVTV